MIDFDDLNQDMLDEFGEPLTYTVNGVPATITGIITRPQSPLGADSADMQAALRPRLMTPGLLLVTALTSAVAAAGITNGAALTVDGKVYKVVRLWPDDGGMTAIEHRA
jgi:hypothetical protein